MASSTNRYGRKPIMKINEEDREFISRYIPDAVNLMDGTDGDSLLMKIDGFINRNGFAPPDYEYYNDLGEAAQCVYDRIYADADMDEKRNEDRYCPAAGKVISGDVCYELWMCLMRMLKLSSVPEVEIRDPEQAAKICAKCPRSIEWK